MEIPYNVELRKDTGLYNSKLGIWLFLASEVMLFGGLFSAYVLLRIGAEIWPEGASILNVPLATLNTVVLISSSITGLRWRSVSRTPPDAACWTPIPRLGRNGRSGTYSSLRSYNRLSVRLED